MVKKRKLEPKIVEPPPPQEVEEEAEEIEEDEEVEEEEYEEVEEEEEEEEEEGGGTQNAAKKSASTSAVDDDDDEEPIQKILEPFSKDQLINLLREAAEKHADVAERLRRVADEDPVHRKIFVHGLGWDTNAETLISVFKDYDSERGSEGAEAAAEKIGNRMTACQLASIGPVPSPAVGQAAMSVSAAQSVSEYTQRKIYVSNVGAELDPQKLLVFFSKYGEIEEGPLGLDKQTGKPKGFCLFVYKTAEGAKKALDEPHKNFDGHILHCQKAIDGPKPGKQQQLQQQQHHHNLPNTHYTKSEITNFMGPQGHLMAPSGPPAIPYNQGSAAQALNPALGQALTALLATQGAGLGLTNLLGTLGSASVGAGVNPSVAGAGHGMQGGYPNQAVAGNISSGMVGGYGSQGAYGNQQMGQGSSSGRSQHGVGHMGGMAPYMGH
ncbi:UBP1-associated protein 2A [Vitis vinifera]|uniref:UBP1-associated protein 2A n=1 Tax=Vitis vinifera TaxID=29760 RepID=A0A438H8S3_VITVI|nr:UBP1-associated protein 2A [Vitis vinifera]